MFSAPLSVVKTMIVLSNWPICSSFASTAPMLSFICFMPASFTPQSLPPGSPTMAMYLGDSTVVMCMRAGLYQTKKGLPVFFGSLRSRKSTTFAEISSSTVFERSSVRGPSSLQVWFFPVPSEDLHESTGRGDARDRRVLARRHDGLPGWTGVDVGEAYALHCIQVVQVAPEFLEAVGSR